MELSDLLMDIEGSKMISSCCIGGVIGIIGGILNFDDLFLESNKKLVSKNPKVNLEFSKGVISLATSLQNVNYEGPFVGDTSELLIYGAYIRVGYEAGNKIVKSVKNYIRK